MIIGSIVLTPWPISGFFAMTVTVPSAAILTKAVGKSGAAGPNCASRSATGST